MAKKDYRFRVVLENDESGMNVEVDFTTSATSLSAAMKEVEEFVAQSGEDVEATSTDKEAN